MIDRYEPRPPEIPKLLLSPPEAAQALSVSEKTLWSHSQPRGSIPVVRIGARVLYDPRDLLAWIDQQKTAGGGENGQSV